MEAHTDKNSPYDLVLRGGRLICPASKLDGVMDLAIRGGRIAAIQPTIAPSAARAVIDVRGRLVLPGLIDTHGHCYKYVTGRFGLDADLVGVQSGVTTVVDQGGASCMTSKLTPSVASPRLSAARRDESPDTGANSGDRRAERSSC